MSEIFKKVNNDVSIVISGEAGQGIQTIEFFLTRVLKLSGYNVFATKEYMSRIRGGSNSTQIRVSSNRVKAFLNRIDILIPLNKSALTHLKKRIGRDTLILGEKRKLGSEYNIYDIPISRVAIELGNKIYENMLALGVICKIFKVEADLIHDYLKRFFAKKGAEIIEKNFQAVKIGYQYANKLFSEREIELQKNQEVRDEILMSGAEAVALGAIAGGCDFISAYPMSPSTPVWVYLSQHSHIFDIISEQAEDEISAINMALGAWYAGARALVSTSGGGFALMAEGVSLAGMLESPLVIHLAQRPGPATGLPTRTEQADLNLALYAGHGEFPRIILAPGTLEDAFYLTQMAFNLADKYQVPVFLLTDQFLIDSFYNIPRLDLSSLRSQRYIAKTDSNYSRYIITEDGVSPRGIPGFGDGLVIVDSDEHDQNGHITEDLELRERMVDKRLRKYQLIQKEIIPPELIGENDYRFLVIGWGSTYNPIKEALNSLNRKDIALLYFKQVYPIHESVVDYLSRSEKVIFVENNAGSQFGRLVQLHTGFNASNTILSYSGLPFAVEDIAVKIKKLLD